MPSLARAHKSPAATINVRYEKRKLALAIGKNKEEPVTLVRDDEFSDRYFLVAETKNKSVIRVTIGGTDLNSFVIALRQAKEDLDGADTESMA